MRIFFALESAEIFYHYRSVIGALCSRGHTVKAFFAKGIAHEMRPANSMDVVKEFNGEFVDFDYSDSRYEPDFVKKIILFPKRAIANYRRFLKIEDRPSFYKDRYKKLLPFWLRPFVLSDFLNINFLIKLDLFGKALSFVEDFFSPDKQIIGHIKDFSPDIIFVSSGNVVSSSPDFEYLRAARFLKIPNALLVASWDYLETKGLLHIIPDTLLVWNSSHFTEAVNSHGVPEERIKIVGAPLFDDFFSETQFFTDKNKFCSKYNLRPENPMALFIGSSGIFGDESKFLRSLRSAFDNSGDERIKKTQILVRPHPTNRKSFKKAVADMKNVFVIPESGEMPNTLESLRLFGDTLHYSDIIISIGSSGLLNAIILNKPSITVLVDYYRHIQTEAPHFKHLLESGAIKIVEDFNDAPKFLNDILSGNDETKKQRDLFIKDYIRPRGLEYSAGEIVADELENSLRLNVK